MWRRLWAWLLALFGRKRTRAVMLPGSARLTISKS